MTPIDPGLTGEIEAATRELRRRGCPSPGGTPKLWFTEDLVKIAGGIVKRVDSWFAGLGPRFQSPGFQDEIMSIRLAMGDLVALVGAWPFGVVPYYVPRRRREITVQASLVERMAHVAAGQAFPGEYREPDGAKAKVWMPAVMVRRRGQFVVQRNGRRRVADFYMLTLSGVQVPGAGGELHRVCALASRSLKMDHQGQLKPLELLEGRDARRAAYHRRKKPLVVLAAPPPPKRKKWKGRHGDRIRRAILHGMVLRADQKGCITYGSK